MIKGKSIKKVTIILKPNALSEFSEVLPNLYTWLTRRKITVQFLDTEASRLNKIFNKLPKSCEYLTDKELFTKSDLIISLGGDGTLLGLSRKVSSAAPPIFGVNMGRLGFITEFSKVEFFEELSVMLNKGFETTQLALYKVEIKKRNKTIFESHFLNDLVVGKNDISRMFGLAVASEGEHIYNISGDGLIVSSPIGSTAYSLAAGGPILHPGVNATILTPICPHSLTYRPLAIPDKDQISIKLLKNESPVNITLDGQETTVLNPHETILIKKNNRKKVTLVKNTERTYYQALKEKFIHGRREV